MRTIKPRAILTLSLATLVLGCGPLPWTGPEEAPDGAEQTEQALGATEDREPGTSADPTSEKSEEDDVDQNPATNEEEPTPHVSVAPPVGATSSQPRADTASGATVTYFGDDAVVVSTGGTVTSAGNTAIITASSSYHDGTVCARTDVSCTNGAGYYYPRPTTTAPATPPPTDPAAPEEDPAPESPPVTQPVPAHLTAEANGLQVLARSSSSIELLWSQVPASVETIALQRLNGTVFEELAALPSTEGSYLDQDLEVLTTYSYRFIAVNPAGASLPSAVLTATTFLPAPSAPSDFAAVQDIENTSLCIALSWQAEPLPETRTFVERSADGVTFSLLDPAGTETTRAIDCGDDLKRNKTYRYRAYRSNPSGTSPLTATLDVLLK